MGPFSQLQEKAKFLWQITGSAIRLAEGRLSYRAYNTLNRGEE
jgi:hypothetical protein